MKSSLTETLIWANNYLHLGDWIYLLYQNGTKNKKKVNFIGNNNFEFNGGWAEVKDLTINENAKSLIKYELKIF